MTIAPRTTLPFRPKSTGRPSIATIEKFQDALMDTLDRVRARAQESGETGVGPRGPIPAGKGMTPAEKMKVKKREEKKENRKKKGLSTGVVRNAVPYRKYFCDLRPKAGFLYDSVPDISKKHADAIRDRVGELSENGVISVTVFDARLREAFDAATELARLGRLSPEMFIYKLTDAVPWLAGLDTVTVGCCLDYFWQARKAYQGKYLPNSYRPGGQTDPDSAQAVSRLAVTTTQWLVSADPTGLLGGLGGADLRPFQLEEGFALMRQWVDPESEEEEDDDSEDSEAEYEAFRQRMLAEEAAMLKEEGEWGLEEDY